jgi:hypothetical protein
MAHISAELQITVKYLQSLHPEYPLTRVLGRLLLRMRIHTSFLFSLTFHIHSNHSSEQQSRSTLPRESVISRWRTRTILQPTIAAINQVIVPHLRIKLHTRTAQEIVIVIVPRTRSHTVLDRIRDDGYDVRIGGE